MAEAATPNTEKENSADHERILSDFQDITGKTDGEECAALLEKHKWILEAAVQSVFSMEEGVPSTWDDVHVEPAPPPPETITTPLATMATTTATSMSLQPQPPQGWGSWLINLPYNFLHFGFSFLYHTASEFVLFVVRIVFPGFGRVATNPIEDVTKFKDEYEKKYGTTHPTFYLGSYGQALSDARSELRFLLVYLHCEQHQNTPQFCRDVLSNPAFRDHTIRKRALFWACNVDSNEGRKVSRAMRERTYPFIGVVCLRDNKMSVVWRIEGCMGLDQLVAVCEQVFHDNEASLVAAQAERNERDITRGLRDEQDAEFNKSLESDKRKSAQRKKEEDQEKEAERMKQEKENEKQRKIEDLAKKREDCRLKFESLVEPASTDLGAIKLRIKCSNGEILQRHFLKTDLLQDVYDYVLCSEDSPASFQLCTNFPRNIYPVEVNSAKSLETLGIKGATQFFVQDLTSDDEDSEEEY